MKYAEIGPKLAAILDGLESNKLFVTLTNSTYYTIETPQQEELFQFLKAANYSRIFYKGDGYRASYCSFEIVREKFIVDRNERVVNKIE